MSVARYPSPVDIAVIGAGVAGQIAALAARGALTCRGSSRPADGATPRVALIEGKTTPGAKLLISGGGRCNITNETVTDRDFVSDRPAVVRGVLAEFPVGAVRRFFEERGCPLVCEPLGKIYPASSRARDILQCLVEATEAAGIEWMVGRLVEDVTRDGDRWKVELSRGVALRARRVIVATGGMSVPSTGSSGFGFDLARRLGIAVREPCPALVGLRMRSPARELAGITVPVALSVVTAGTPRERVCGRRYHPRARAAGSLLFTHSGVSGPAVLDVSGAWERARLEEVPVELLADFWSLQGPGSVWGEVARASGPRMPGACLRAEQVPPPISAEAFREDVEGQERRLERSGPPRGKGHSLESLVSSRLPRRLARWLLDRAGVDRRSRSEEMGKQARARVYEALVHARLSIVAGEGFRKAEVTEGGVVLAELERRTLEHERLAGLHFCGEVVNVTGRLGGFNFQWAFSSGFVAGQGACRGLGPS